MKYTEIRDQIKTGDLIAVRRRSGLFPIATRVVTRSPYTHTGIALWCEGRLLLAQTNGGGCNIVPLSQEAVYDFDVFDCPVDDQQVESWIWNLLGTRIPYGFVDCVRIGLHCLFGIPLPKQDGADLVCSALSALIFRKAGWNPVNLPSIPWPGAVVSALNVPARIQVSGS